ncbi:hypothetical protein BLA18109_07241 [Burkholderia lata]|uniref:Uncharacterized protein n=1 Tax=Burkholderia lata (strain ATCC 17760 / DSM 23089 / LMG 22485 / NCIMB 9086 / R18194 / 383) TaxID=482957 RepID=A0A6P2ZVM0_BURL3|nr:hypothetical protein BLA18109_07241 [Burkholderia lata]
MNVSLTSIIGIKEALKDNRDVVTKNSFQLFNGLPNRLPLRRSNSVDILPKHNRTRCSQCNLIKQLFVSCISSRDFEVPAIRCCHVIKVPRGPQHWRLA